MIRYLPLILAIFVAVYALADWKRTPEDAMPGGLGRHLWLLILIITIPTFAIGSIAWVIMRMVMRAEARQRGEEPEPTLFEDLARKANSGVEEPPAPVAPDDDPKFLERLQRDIARRKAEERLAAEKDEERRRAQERHERREQGEKGQKSDGAEPDASENK